MKVYDEDEMYELRQEFGKPRSRVVQCSDRMCGADDCPNCHPEIKFPQPLNTKRHDGIRRNK